MSFGKSDSSNQQQAQSTSSTQLNPQILSDLLSNYNQAQTLNTPYVPYTGQQVAPLNATQQAADAGVLGIAANNTGGAELNSAANTTAGVAGYTPQTVAPGTYDATTGSATLAPTAAQAAAVAIDPSDVQTVTAPTVGADQINSFLNPYTSDVVNTTDAQMLQQEQINQAANAAQATKAGAFGGSGSAVLDGLTNLNYQEALGQTNAGLNSAGYTQALTAAQQQAAQQLAAATSNQGTALSAGTTNASLAEQTALANQAATNSQSQFNAANQNTFGLANLNATNSASAANAAAAQAAAVANQSAGLTGAGLNLQAGTQQASISAQQLAQALGIQQAVQNVGTQEQSVQQAQDTAAYNNYLNQQNWPLMLQQLMNQSLGLAGNPTTSTSQSTSSGSGSSSGLNLGLPNISGGGGG